jgi:phosphoglycolate phosphatase-like HAD superfamily hydrolase
MERSSTALISTPRPGANVLQRFGFQIPFEDLRVQIGKSGDELLKGVLPPDVIEQNGAEIQRFRSRLFERVYLHKVRAFHCVRQLFERIRASGTKIVLASCGRAEEVERYKEVAGIADLIDGATSSDDAERSKPFPTFFVLPSLSLRLLVHAKRSLQVIRPMMQRRHGMPE